MPVSKISLFFFCWSHIRIGLSCRTWWGNNMARELHGISVHQLLICSGWMDLEVILVTNHWKILWYGSSCIFFVATAAVISLQRHIISPRHILSQRATVSLLQAAVPFCSSQHMGGDFLPSFFSWKVSSPAPAWETDWFLTSCINIVSACQREP